MAAEKAANEARIAAAAIKEEESAEADNAQTAEVSEEEE